MSGKSDIYDRITALVRRYYLLPKDTVDVRGLLDLRRELAALKYGLAIEAGELYEEKNGAEYRRKSAFAASRAELIGKGDSAAKAEALALAETAEQMKDEALADAAWKKAALILDSVGDVLGAISQQIANLRQEKNEEFAGIGSQTA